MFLTGLFEFLLLQFGSYSYILNTSFSLYIYICFVNIFPVCGLFFQNKKKKPIVCQTVEDINEDQPTYFHLWRVLGIIFKKPLTHGTGVMAQSVMCFLCWVQSSQNIHTKTGHGGTHLQSQCWGGRDGQIVGAPQLII